MVGWDPDNSSIQAAIWNGRTDSSCYTHEQRTNQKTASKPAVGLPRIPVADRGGEKVDVGFSDFGPGTGNQLWDPGRGGATPSLSRSTRSGLADG